MLRAAPIAISRNVGPEKTSGKTSGEWLVASAQMPRTANAAPDAGVHKPGTSSAPAAIAKAAGTASPMGGPVLKTVIAWVIAEAPPASRRIRRPAPGAPRAKVEKSRRTGVRVQVL